MVTMLMIRNRPLIDDGGADIKGYNDELAKRGNPSWFNVSWLYSECYLYRFVNHSRSRNG